MKLSVVGGAGRMGSWFSRYFANRGYETTIYDVKKGRARALALEIGATPARNLSEATRTADVVLLAVPLEKTPSLIREVSRLLKRGGVMAEIASLKAETVKELKRAAANGVTPLSVHPLFGPGARGLNGKRVAIIPVIDSSREKRLARSLLPEASFVSVDAEGHDRAMAIVLSLTHFVNTVFFDVVSREDVGRLRALGGTSFTLQLNLAEGLLQDEPELLTSLLVDNRHASKGIRSAMKKASRLTALIEAKRKEELHRFYRRLRRRLAADVDFAKSYQKIYEALSLQEGSSL